MENHKNDLLLKSNFMVSSFDKPQVAGTFLPRYQSKLLQLLIDGISPDYSSETRPIKIDDVNTSSKLGIDTESNELSTSNFDSKVLFISITVESENDMPSLNSTINSIKLNITNLSTVLGIAESNILVIVSLLNHSISLETFNHFFMSSGSTYMLGTPYYFAFTKYSSFSNSFNVDLDFLMVYNHQMTKFSSQKMIQIGLIPHLTNIETIQSRKTVLINIDSGVTFKEDSISLLVRSLILSKSDGYSSAAVGYPKYSISRFNINNFFSCLSEFENIQRVTFGSQMEGLYGSTQITHKFYCLNLSDLHMHEALYKYYTNLTFYDYDSNIHLHDSALTEFIAHSEGKRRTIHLVPDACYSLDVHASYTYDKWLLNNAMLNSAYLSKSFNQASNLFKRPGLRTLLSVYNIIISTFRLLLPGLITLTMFVICMIGFKKLNPSYGMTALFPLVFVISLMTSLIGELKYTKGIQIVINVFFIFYFWFAKILIIVALNNSFKLQQSLDAFINKDAFIALIVINFVFAVVPYMLNCKSNFSCKGIASSLAFILMYPSYLSNLMSLTYQNIFNQVNGQLKLLLILIVLIANFIISMLIYTVHSHSGSHSYLLAIAIIGTIVYSIRFFSIVWFFVLYNNCRKAEFTSVLGIRKVQEYFFEFNPHKEEEIKLIDKDSTPPAVAEEEVREHKNFNIDKNILADKPIVKEVGRFNDEEKGIPIGDDEGIVYGESPNPHLKNEETPHNYDSQVDEKLQSNLHKINSLDSDTSLQKKVKDHQQKGPGVSDYDLKKQAYQDDSNPEIIKEKLDNSIENAQILNNRINKYNDNDKKKEHGDEEDIEIEI